MQWSIQNSLKALQRSENRLVNKDTFLLQQEALYLQEKMRRFPPLLRSNDAISFKRVSCKNFQDESLQTFSSFLKADG